MKDRTKINSTKNRVKSFVFSGLITLLVLRTYLFIFENSNFNLGSYNIHHLYTGGILLIVAVIFLITGFINRKVIILSGIASAMMIDEFVYLIATDGSDGAYLTPVSWIGAIILTIFFLILTGGIYYYEQNNKN